VTETKSKILVIEDDQDLAEMLNAYLRVQGYEVITENWGEDGIRAAQTERPDLLILDIRLPDIDGFEVARQLRSDRKTSDIPIIFLTEKRERSDKLAGLALGADDYITKPFDVQEMRLRVRNVLKRSKQDSLTNPVTGLPEGPLVDEKLSECLQRDGSGALGILIENIEHFRDAYGFVAKDDVLRAISLILNNALREAGYEENGFVGHLTPTDFVMVIPQNALSSMEERIHTRLEQSLDFFYPMGDRDKQTDRLGVRINLISPGEQHITGLVQVKSEILKRK
jgi:DNA-binding response OmpR family regulator